MCDIKQNLLLDFYFKTSVFTSALRLLIEIFTTRDISVSILSKSFMSNETDGV